MAFSRVAVRVFFGQPLDFENPMILEKSHDLISSVIGCVVNKENDALDSLSFCISNKVAEMPPKLDIPAALKRIPHYALVRPEECNKAIHPFGVTKCCDKTCCAFFSPAALDFRQKFCPFLVLESYENFFLKRAGAMRLYRLISARFR